MGLVIPASLTVQRLLLHRFRHVSTRVDRVATITRGEGGAVTAVKMRVKKRVISAGLVCATGSCYTLVPLGGRTYRQQIAAEVGPGLEED
jgi:hypothetical protein